MDGFAAGMVFGGVAYAVAALSLAGGSVCNLDPGPRARIADALLVNGCPSDRNAGFDSAGSLTRAPSVQTLANPRVAECIAYLDHASMRRAAASGHELASGPGMAVEHSNECSGVRELLSEHP